jgi:hypothetical protein
MQKSHFLAAAAIAATLGLGACNSEPETITYNRPDAQAEALRNAAPVELPPAIQASRTYRCRDNSLVYVDFYTNDTARLRIGSRDAEVTTLTADGGEPPYTADGYSVSANAPEIRFTAPGRGTQACHS